MSLTGMTTQKGDLDKLGVDCMNTGINKGDVKTVTAVSGTAALPDVEGPPNGREPPNVEGPPEGPEPPDIDGPPNGPKAPNEGAAGENELPNP